MTLDDNEVIITDDDEIILSNEITMHRSTDEVIKAFRNLINKYSILFIDIDFANLLKNN